MNAKTKSAAEAEKPESETVAQTAEQTAQAESKAAANKAAIEAFRAKIKGRKNVTLPLFKWVAGTPMFLKLTGEIFQGKEIKGAGAKNKEPAFLMNVTDLMTGEEGQVIVPAVLRSVLTEDYPDHGYVGKSFELKQRKLPGKSYNGYDVTEIEL